jgi:uncharacterized Fe-S cluster protein YjdI
MARSLQTYTAGPLEVEYEPARCIHAAECVRRLPRVFNPKARPWVRPDAAESDEVVRAVLACPTGALRVRVDGTAIERVPERPQVRLAAHGPLQVHGDVRVVDEAGDDFAHGPRAALCRCGQSKRKPWCDGSHHDAGFRDPA